MRTGRTVVPKKIVTYKCTQPLLFLMVFLVSFCCLTQQALYILVSCLQRFLLPFEQGLLYNEICFLIALLYFDFLDFFSKVFGN